MSVNAPELALPKVTLVLGGVASGKSGYAEHLIRRSGRTKTYIATAQAFDKEMTDKISQHKVSRGENWYLIEEPLNLPAALAQVPKGNAILVDCLTLWLSNHMLNNGFNDSMVNELLNIEAFGPIVYVSNEVGLAPVPGNTLARRFQREQGRLNQRIAAMADLVIFLRAGLPQILKGSLPGNLT